MLNFTKILRLLITTIIVLSISFVNISVIFTDTFSNNFVEISALFNSSSDIEVNENHESDNENELISEILFKKDLSSFRTSLSNNHHYKKVNTAHKIIFTPPPEYLFFS